MSCNGPQRRDELKELMVPHAKVRAPAPLAAARTRGL
jgi:hypothetical protein